MKGEKEEFEPVLGEKYLFWNDNPEDAEELIFAGKLGKYYTTFECESDHETYLDNNINFCVWPYKNTAPIPEKELTAEEWIEENDKIPVFTKLAHAKVLEAYHQYKLKFINKDPCK